MRWLDQNARAVPGIGLAPAGAAVVQVVQHLQGLLDNRMGLAAFDIDHKAHPAGLVLKLRIIKPLFARWPSVQTLTTMVVYNVFPAHF
jgi:hypothetical protein